MRLFETALETDEQWGRWLGVLRRWPEHAGALRDWAAEQHEDRPVEEVLAAAESLQAWPELRDALRDPQEWTSWADIMRPHRAAAAQLGSLAVDLLAALAPDRPPEEVARVLRQLAADQTAAQQQKEALREVDLAHRVDRVRRRWRQGGLASLAAAAGLLLALGLPLPDPDDPEEMLQTRGAPVELLEAVRLTRAGEEPVAIEVGRGLRPLLPAAPGSRLTLEREAPAQPGRKLGVYGIDSRGEIVYFGGSALAEVPEDGLQVAIGADLRTLVLVSLPADQFADRPELAIGDGTRPTIGVRGQVFITAIDLEPPR